MLKTLDNEFARYRTEVDRASGSGLAQS
jgi:hypothetical protein